MDKQISYFKDDKSADPAKALSELKTAWTQKFYMPEVKAKALARAINSAIGGKISEYDTYVELLCGLAATGGIKHAELGSAMNRGMQNLADTLAGGVGVEQRCESFPCERNVFCLDSLE